MREKDDDIINFINEELDKKEGEKKFEEEIDLKDNDILNKLYELQKLIKKESILRKLCN